MNRALWWAVVSTLEEIKGLIARSKGLEGLRTAIRGQLTQLRRQMSAAMPEAEVYKVMFPLVIYSEELVLRHLSEREQTQWPLLQAELYQIRDGGEALYRLLDEELEKPDMIPALAEVMFYCLNDGFLGRYSEESLKIKEYQDRLAARIQARAKKLGGLLAPPDADPAAPAAATAAGKRKRPKPARSQAAVAAGEAPDAATPAPTEPPVRRRRKRARSRVTLMYYLGAAAILLATPFLLLWLSNM